MIFLISSDALKRKMDTVPDFLLHAVPMANTGMTKRMDLMPQQHSHYSKAAYA